MKRNIHSRSCRLSVWGISNPGASAAPVTGGCAVLLETAEKVVTVPGSGKAPYANPLAHRVNPCEGKISTITSTIRVIVKKSGIIDPYFALFDETKIFFFSCLDSD